MKNKIEEMKCPYCGNEKNLDYGNLIDSGYCIDMHWAVWEVECSKCNNIFRYSENYCLNQASNEK